MTRERQEAAQILSASAAPFAFNQEAIVKPPTTQRDPVRIQKLAERRRKRIGKGIYRDKYGISATVKVGTGIAAMQREKRFPFDTSLKDIKAWQEAMRGELRTAAKRPTTARGTFAEDAKVYLAQVKHLASYKSRVCEVNAWTALYGRLRRVQLTSEHVRKARATWTADEYTPKTINNRMQTPPAPVPRARRVAGHHAGRRRQAARGARFAEGARVGEGVQGGRQQPHRPEDAGAVHGDRVHGRQAGRVEAC